MPWISRTEYDRLQNDATMGRDAVAGARRQAGKLGNIIHRQRCAIKNLKDSLNAVRAIKNGDLVVRGEVLSVDSDRLVKQVKVLYANTHPQTIF